MNTTTFEQTLTAAELHDRNHRHHVDNGRRARGEIVRISERPAAFSNPVEQIGRESRSVAPNRG